MENKPQKLTVNRETNVLSITWKDGHLSDYSFTLMRLACPCVECMGGHEKMGNKPPPEAFSQAVENSQRTHINTIDPIGSYAISIHWGDGHSTGIYNWDYLRKMCPCLNCRNFD